MEPVDGRTRHRLPMLRGATPGEPDATPRTTKPRPPAGADGHPGGWGRRSGPLVLLNSSVVGGRERGVRPPAPARPPPPPDHRDDPRRRRPRRAFYTVKPERHSRGHRPEDGLPGWCVSRPSTPRLDPQALVAGQRLSCGSETCRAISLAVAAAGGAGPALAGLPAVPALRRVARRELRDAAIVVDARNGEDDVRQTAPPSATRSPARPS